VLDRGQSLLAECEHFRVSRVQTGHAVPEGRFRLIMPITDVQWAGETLAPGDLALLPASAAKAAPVGEWLEIEMPV